MTTAIIFDLDDTLFQEQDFVESSYREIARRLADVHRIDPEEPLKIMTESENAFDSLAQWLETKGFPEDIVWMLNVYRTHFPTITLAPDVAEALLRLRRAGCQMRIMTEGRELTQSNKIKALGLDRLMTLPPLIFTPRERGGEGKNFEVAAAGINAERFVSVGDNPLKDFSQPLSLGWLTVAIADSGRNIHPQDFSTICPHHIISSVADLPAIIL